MPGVSAQLSRSPDRSRTGNLIQASYYSQCGDAVTDGRGWLTDSIQPGIHSKSTHTRLYNEWTGHVVSSARYLVHRVSRSLSPPVRHVTLATRSSSNTCPQSNQVQCNTRLSSLHDCGELEWNNAVPSDGTYIEDKRFQDSSEPGRLKLHGARKIITTLRPRRQTEVGGVIGVIGNASPGKKPLLGTASLHHSGSSISSSNPSPHNRNNNNTSDSSHADMEDFTFNASRALKDCEVSIIRYSSSLSYSVKQWL